MGIVDLNPESQTHAPAPQGHCDATSAAEYLGYEEQTVRASRVDGLLAGVQAPPYIKRGRRVFYRTTVSPPL